MYFPPHFDVKRSVELANLVSQAYEQLDSFQAGVAWAPKGGYVLLKELVQETAKEGLVESHTQFDFEIRLLHRLRTARGRADPIGFVARKDNSIFLVFRGTITVKEWVRNLNVRLASYIEPGWGKVHDGFLATYVSVRSSLLGVLSQQDPRCRLLIAGHSLGAALATLCLPDIAANTRLRDSTVHTFGSPRVGDSQFCKSFDKRFAGRSFRIANTSDVVVSLPLPVPILGVIGGYFAHVETPVDFSVQEDDLERNHSMSVYRNALIESQRNKRLLKSIFGWT